MSRSTYLRRPKRAVQRSAKLGYIGLCARARSTCEQMNACGAGFALIPSFVPTYCYRVIFPCTTPSQTLFNSTLHEPEQVTRSVKRGDRESDTAPGSPDIYSLPHHTCPRTKPVLTSQQQSRSIFFRQQQQQQQQQAFLPQSKD